MKYHAISLVRRHRAAALMAIGLGAFGTAPLLAQDPAAPPSVEYLDLLKECQAKTNDSERLACFDQAVGAMVAANEAGDVQIVDREDVRQTRRKLFGLTLPKLGIFGGDGEDVKLLETNVTSVRYLTHKKMRFTTPEGATWEINNAPRRLRRIEPGDTVVFKKASLGSYFIRINGQTGVKGRRVE